MNSNISKRIIPIEEEDDKHSNKTQSPIIDIEPINQPRSRDTDESTDLIKLCESPLIYNKEKYLIDRNQNKILTIYSTFKCLRTEFKLENSRKNQIGCLVKKVKTKFIKALHEAMKYCINLYIHRLPQEFVTNIKIDYNKFYLNKTVEEIYTEFKIIPPLEQLVNKHLYRKNKKDLLIILMNCKLYEIFQYYLVSDFFKYHYKNIKKKEGENIAKLFDFTAHNLCQYFLLNKGNKKKQKKNNVNLNVNMNNDYKIQDIKFICFGNRSNYENDKISKTKFNVDK